MPVRPKSRNLVFQLVVKDVNDLFHLPLVSSSICAERMLVTGWLDFDFARGMRGQRRYKQVSGRN